MSSFRAETPTIALARVVRVTSDRVIVELTDGREISTPLSWYPRLVHARPAERDRWTLTGHGEGIHWPDVDEDLSVEGMLAGRRSSESDASLRRWLASRDAGDA